VVGQANISWVPVLNVHVLHAVEKVKCLHQRQQPNVKSVAARAESVGRGNAMYVTKQVGLAVKEY